MLLNKSPGNKTSIVPLNGTIRSMFDLEDPFAAQRLPPDEEQYPKYQSAETPGIPLPWPLFTLSIEPPPDKIWAHE